MTGIQKPIGLRLYAQDETALDAFIAAEPDKPSRPEAVRRVLRAWLREHGFLANNR